MDRTKVEAAKTAVCLVAKKMAEAGLTAGTWGNVSQRVDNEYMVITPSGMDYAKLFPENMVLVNLRTHEYEGELKPSIEVPVHAAVYLARPEASGIVHTHSTAALTVASARKPIPAICEDQVQILGGDVRVAPYVMPGSEELAEGVVEALKDRAGALMANHGAIALGRDVNEALTGAVVLEKTARIFLDAMAIGGAVELPEEDCAMFHDFFLHKYGQGKG